jgi:hypothetical protein
MPSSRENISIYYLSPSQKPATPSSRFGSTLRRMVVDVKKIPLLLNFFFAP